MTVPRVPLDSRSRLAQHAGAASPKVAPALPPPPPTKLSRVAAGGRRGRPVDLGPLGPAFIELLGAKRWQAIEVEVAREMKRLGADEVAGDVTTNVLAELAMRVCAEAVRDPEDHGVAFGTLAEWQDLDSDLLNLAWRAYDDVRDELDPVAVAASPEVLHEIAAAVKKKDPALLKSYGCARLAAYLLSMESPPSTSSTPSSSNTESPPA